MTVNNKFLLLTLAFLIFAITSGAHAEIRPGVRTAVYFDPTDAAIGAELLMNLDRDHRVSFNPNFEFVFLERADLWTVNFDFHYDLLSAREPVYLWVGAGPAILFRDPDNDRLDSDTDFGVNIFVGLGFKIRGSSLVPYIQPKYTVADNDRFSIAFGLRF